MEYFLLSEDKRNPTPVVKNWYKTIDPRLLTRERYKEVNRLTTFYVEPNENTFYSDVLTDPYFMVTKGVAEVIGTYDKTIPYRNGIMFDTKNHTKEIYYIPILEAIDCLTEDSVLSMDKSTVKKAVIDPKKTYGKPLFKLGGVRNSYIVARLDFVESILRREARGVALTRIETKEVTTDE